MNEADTPAGAYRRIVVAVDASPESLSALEAAVELAARLQAEVLGLFVEDINLLRLAQLPIAREVRWFSGVVRRLEQEQLEHQFRAQVRRLRQALERLAGPRGVRWQVEVARGEVLVEVRRAAEGGDLLVLGRCGWTRRRVLGSTARALVAAASRPVVMVREGSSLRSPALVLYDGSPGARQALAMAAALVDEANPGLTVAVLAASEAEAERLEQEATGLLEGLGRRARFRHLVNPSVERLEALIREEADCFLVLPAGGTWLEGERLLTLLDRLHCPAVVVR